MTYSVVAKLCKAKHRLFFEVYCSAVYTRDISAALHHALLHRIAVVSPKSAKYARSLITIYAGNKVCSHKANLPLHVVEQSQYMPKATMHMCCACSAQQLMV